jgi:hypothetical protein
MGLSANTARNLTAEITENTQDKDKRIRKPGTQERRTQFHDFVLKLSRYPRSSAAALAALRFMSLIPLTPFLIESCFFFPDSWFRVRLLHLSLVTGHFFPSGFMTPVWIRNPITSFSAHFSANLPLAIRWIVIDVIFRSFPVAGAPGRSFSCFP